MSTLKQMEAEHAKSASAVDNEQIMSFDDGEVEFASKPAPRRKSLRNIAKQNALSKEDETVAIPKKSRSIVSADASHSKCTNKPYNDGEVLISNKAAAAGAKARRKSVVAENNKIIIDDGDSDNNDDTVALSDLTATQNEPTVAVARKTRSRSPDVPTLASAPVANENKRRRVSFHKKEPEPVSFSSNSEASAGNSCGIFSDLSRRIVVNNHTYIKLGVLGKGGSSQVHRVVSETTGDIYAYKKVEISDNNNDDENILDGYINEINLLKSLSGASCIIQLYNYEINKEANYIAMIMEAGDIDLAKVLQKHSQSMNKLSSSASGDEIPQLNPFFIRLMWQEMLEAVEHIHNHHIIHGDLKPANFVFVKGHLKLIDFGIAKSYNGNETTNIYRDSQIGTVNYMAPEAISPFTNPPAATDVNASVDGGKVMKLGRASDIWSLGCILYQMIYGRPPFSALTTIQKLHAIPNPKFEIKYPPSITINDTVLPVDTTAIESIKACLHREPKERHPIKSNNQMKGLLSLSYLVPGNPVVEQNTTAAASSKTQLILDNDKENDVVIASKKGRTPEEEDDFAPTVAVASQLKALGAPPIRLKRPALNSITSSLAGNSNISNSPKRNASPYSTRSSSRSANNENVVPVRNKVLPPSLQQQILSKSASLTDSQHSRGNKWMKKEKSPAKSDMKSVLEKRFAEIRQFLETDDVDEDDEDNTQSFDMSFI